MVAPLALSMPRFSRARDVIININLVAAGGLANAVACIEDMRCTLIDLDLAWGAVGTNTAVIRAAWAHLSGGQRTSLSQYAKSRAANAAVQAVLDIAAVAPDTPAATSAPR